MWAVDSIIQCLYYFHFQETESAGGQKKHGTDFVENFDLEKDVPLTGISNATQYLEID